MNYDHREMMNERTLVLIKPETVQRGYIGEVITIFERAGLKIVAAKFLIATKKQLDGHFHGGDEWLRGIGRKTTEGCREDGLRVEDVMGTSDPLEIGRKIKEQLYHYLSSGPMMALVLEGIHAVKVVRKLTGHTIPAKAETGTIRAMYSIASADLASVVGSPARNVIHASSSVDEAKIEIRHWFKDSEVVEWKKIDEDVLFTDGDYTKISDKKGNQP